MQKYLAIGILILSCCFTLTGQEQDSDVKELFKMTLEELLEIEISTAGKTPEKVGDIPASVVIITREEIKTYGYTSFVDILKHVPGLYIMTDYHSQNLGIRGFWSDLSNRNMIILINGVNVRNDHDGNYKIPTTLVPVEAIDRIEVIRGPMSVTYGSGAFFGVINIVTNEFDVESGNNSFSLKFGSDDYYSAVFRTAGLFDGLKYTLNTKYQKFDGLNASYSDLANSYPEHYSIEESDDTNGFLESEEIYLDFSLQWDSFKLDFLTRRQDRGFFFSIPTFPKGGPSIRNPFDYFLSASYTKEFSTATYLEVKLGLTENITNFDIKWYHEDFYLIQRQQSKAFEGEVNLNFLPFEELHVTTGVYLRNVFEVENIVTSSEAFGEIKDVAVLGPDGIMRKAVFTQVNYHPHENISLIAGLRFEQLEEYRKTIELNKGHPDFSSLEDKYSQDDWNVIPRVAMVYCIDDINRLKILYGQAINMPSFFHNSTTMFAGQGLPLQPEKIETWEVNYIGSPAEHSLLTLSLFCNSFENLIVRRVYYDEAGEHDETTNSGEMMTLGAEVSWKMEFENYGFEIAGSYQTTEDNTPGREDVDFSMSPEFLGYLNAHYNYNEHFTLGLTANYVGSMLSYYDTGVSNEDNSFGTFIGPEIDPYLNVGLNIRVDDIFSPGTFLNTKISNLFDEEIRHPTAPLNTWATKGYLDFGRAVVVTIGIDF